MAHILLLAQVDDCSGEVLGEALEQLVALGVRNVQLLSSLTKKGRPGSILLLDLERDLELRVAAYLAAELGVWGYHVLQSSHEHFDVSLEERQVRVTSEQTSRSFTIHCKLFRKDGELLRVKLEHADVVELCDLIHSLGGRGSLTGIRGWLEQEILSHPSLPELALAL